MSQALPPTLSTGATQLQRLARYSPQRVLGQGSFGRAVLVQDEHDHTLKVLKCVQLSRLTDAAAARARSEATLLAQLEHPNVLRHFESFLVGTRLCIVTEFAEQGDLRQTMAARQRLGQQFSEQEVASIALQVVDALAYLHSRSVLHRDVKAENILLKDGLQVKLGDFGVAKELVNGSATTDTAVGTPLYLSPEICKQQPYDSKTDMWALGCVLYELLTLKHAFVASSFSQLCQRIVSAEYMPIDRQCDAFFVDLVARLLRPDHTQRPSAVQVQRLLQQYTRPSRTRSIQAQMRNYTMRPSVSFAPSVSSGVADPTPASPQQPPAQAPAVPSQPQRPTPHRPIAMPPHAVAAPGRHVHVVGAIAARAANAPEMVVSGVPVHRRSPPPQPRVSAAIAAANHDTMADVRLKIKTLYKQITTAQTSSRLRQADDAARTAHDGQVALWMYALRLQLQRLHGIDAFAAAYARGESTLDVQDRVYLAIVAQLRNWERHRTAFDPLVPISANVPLTLNQFLRCL